MSEWASREWRENFERTWRLFPTTENLRRLFGFFTHYMAKHFNGSYRDLDAETLQARRDFLKELAYKILAWFSLYRKHIVDGEYFFDGVEDRLRKGVIDKAMAGIPFDKADLEKFLGIFEQLSGPYSYMVEVNGTTGVQDGVQNGGHIFRGIHVTGLPGGSVYEVMRELYDTYGGPYSATDKREKVYLRNPQGDDINKLRMRVMKYIELLEEKTQFDFPIEVKVSGPRLLVISRGTNSKARINKPKPTKKTGEPEEG